MTDLNSEFAQRIEATIHESCLLGYVPTGFQQMLASTDAVSLAKQLVISGNLQDGLKRLAKMGRTDLSIESVMLEPQFQTLFSAEHLRCARWRLSLL